MSERHTHTAGRLTVGCPACLLLKRYGSPALPGFTRADDGATLNKARVRVTMQEIKRLFFPNHRGPWYTLRRRNICTPSS